jgi:hypothetical protein
MKANPLNFNGWTSPSYADGVKCLKYGKSTRLTLDFFPPSKVMITSLRFVVVSVDSLELGNRFWMMIVDWRRWEELECDDDDGGNASHVMLSYSLLLGGDGGGELDEDDDDDEVDDANANSNAAIS